MQTKILRVVSQAEAVYVPSRKKEGGQMAKCVIIANDIRKIKN